MKDKLLKLLQENSDNYLSGEAISEIFNVSRTAIWKQINSLRKEGYVIESITNRGYKLIKDSNNITASGILSKLNTEVLGRDIICLNEVDSTNNYAKIIAANGAKDGTLIVAEKQNAGRGRLGRGWSSASGKGIWMSLLLRPKIEPQKAQIITLAAAVAIVKALYPLLGDMAKVKWPNDVLVNGKKICGILTEMSCELENINYLVLGIGLNVNHREEDFPEELRITASSVIRAMKEKEEQDRVPIIADILKAFEELYLLILEGKTDKVIDNWRNFSATLGKEVKVKSVNNELCGIARDITNDGVLLLEDSKGVIHRVLSGEVFF